MAEKYTRIAKKTICLIVYILVQLSEFFYTLSTSMKNKNCAAFFSGILGISAIAATLTAFKPAQAFNIQVFTDKNDWIEALEGTPFETEDFADGIFDDFNFISDSGNGTIESGEFQDRLIRNQSTTFNFLGESGLTAFGGDWDTGRRPRGLGIAVTLANGMTETVDQEISNSSNFDFFGVLTDSPFESIILNAGTQRGVAETFSLDNVVYGMGEFDIDPDPDPDPTPVPEPSATVGFIIVGLIGAAAKRKKQLAAKKYL